MDGRTGKKWVVRKEALRWYKVIQISGRRCGGEATTVTRSQENEAGEDVTKAR